MLKPIIEQFGLTEAEYNFEANKETKISDYVQKLILAIILILNAYLIFVKEPFSLSRIPEILILNLIGIPILLTWFFVMFVFVPSIISLFFPNLRLIKHSKKYLDYRKAIDSYEREERNQKDIKEFIDRAFPPEKIDKKVLEAEKILNLYAGIIVNGLKTGIAFKKSLLPHSVARIKQAYFTYVDYVIKTEGKLSEADEIMFTDSYSRLDFFIEDEEADEINELFLLHKNNHERIEIGKSKKFRDFIKNRYTKNSLNEIKEFIIDCYKKYGKKI